jgi:hypothetical protein
MTNKEKITLIDCVLGTAEDGDRDLNKIKDFLKGWGYRADREYPPDEWKNDFEKFGYELAQEVLG